jgi:hypothetical protein
VSDRAVKSFVSGKAVKGFVSGHDFSRAEKASQNDGVLTPERCFMRIATVSIRQTLAPEEMPRQIRTSPAGGEGFNPA